MNSILNIVDKYIKDNGIEFKDITVSCSYFPKYINQAILNKIREFKFDYDFGDCEYTLSYDNSDNLYLIAHDSTRYVNLIIANTKLDLEENYGLTIVSELSILAEACMLKYINQERIAIRNMLNDRYNMLPVVERIKLENDIINSLVRSKFDEFSKNGENILNIVEYKEEIDKCSNKIINYINYLKDYYEVDMKENSDNEGNGIYFSEPDHDIVGRKNNKNKYTEERERKHDIISFTDRFRALEEYPYIYSDYAYSNGYKEIEYMNYMYQISDNKYILVMEPYSGIKFTRMAIIDSDKQISKEDFNNLVRHYLELSYIDTIRDKSVIRSYHTTIDTYKRLLDYVIKGINNQKINPYMKKRIKGIKEQ